MSDIHCQHCGEPWDHYYLHEVGDHGMDYKTAGRSFAINGCGFRDNTKCDAGMVDPESAAQSIALQELSPYPEEWII